MGRYEDYPETPSRIEAIQAALIPSHEFIEVTDFGMDPILQVHTREYIDYLKTAYSRWIKRGGNSNGVIPDTFACHLDKIYKDIVLDSENIFSNCGNFCFDTAAVIAEHTFKVAYEGAQCSLTAAKYVLDTKTAAFALVRPPGHHSGESLAGGFCFLNNAAIAAEFLINTGARVAILDVDYHHGNGTQTIFYERENPLFASIHGADDYPFYWGNAKESGLGEGSGFNINIPLPIGTTDQQYLETLKDLLNNNFKSYNADFLIVSLGVDTYYADPVGQFDLSMEAYPQIGKLIASLNLPTIFIMEGGYNVSEIGINVNNVLDGFDSCRN